jgi:hypothetical protein
MFFTKGTIEHRKLRRSGKAVCLSELQEMTLERRTVRAEQWMELLMRRASAWNILFGLQ